MRMLPDRFTDLTPAMRYGDMGQAVSEGVELAQHNGIAARPTAGVPDRPLHLQSAGSAPAPQAAWLARIAADADEDRCAAGPPAGTASACGVSPYPSLAAPVGVSRAPNADHGGRDDPAVVGSGHAP